MDNTNILPNEMLIEIFKRLSLESLLNCSRVSHKWRILALQPTAWDNITIIYSERKGADIVLQQMHMKVIKKYYDCLRRIKLQYIDSYEKVISLLGPCRNLISLELNMCCLNVEFYQDMKLWNKLHYFSVKNSRLLNTSVVGCFDFNHLKHLNELYLSTFGLTAENFILLLDCKKLCHINIEKIYILNLNDINTLIICKSSSLISLYLYGMDSINDATFALLAECKNLKNLGIVRCDLLTDNALINMRRFPPMFKLKMWNNKNFSNENLLTTFSQDSFTSLYTLSFSRIDNITIAFIDLLKEHYYNLRFLSMYRCTNFEKLIEDKMKHVELVL